jgi:hypothetical protein
VAAVEARRGWCSSRGGWKIRARITAGYGVGAHNAFYRAGEEGSGREVGSQEAASDKCDFNGACVMVLKRNREEGKWGAREGVERRRRPSGVRSHAEEVAGGARRRTARWHRQKEAAAWA